MSPFQKDSIQILFGEYLIEKINKREDVTGADLTIWLIQNNFEVKPAMHALKTHYSAIDFSIKDGLTFKNDTSTLDHILTDINVKREKAKLNPLEILPEGRSNTEGGEF